MTIEGHGKSLDATADAQHRYLAVVGKTCDEKFGKVALGIDGMEMGRWLLTAIQRIIVASATENQTVDAVEGVDNRLLVAEGRDDKRCAACLHHLLVIGLG
jgi:hypothetical protein